MTSTEPDSDLENLPSPQAAFVRVTLWLSVSAGAAVCFYLAAMGETGYWWPGLALLALSAWPLLKSVRDPAHGRSRLGIHAHGLRMTPARGSGGAPRSLAWNDIERVEVVTPAAPFRGADLRFVLVARNGGGNLEVAAETARSAGLWMALETYLGDLDESLMLRALAAREARQFVVWQRRMGSAAVVAHERVQPA